MNQKYRLLLIRFNYLTARCLFPIIINWQEVLLAKDEQQIIDQIINELQNSPGLTKVGVIHNRLGAFPELQEEFNSIIGDIDFNTETSQIKTLRVDCKTMVDLSKEDIENGHVERFHIKTMHLYVRVIDNERITLETMYGLPILVIQG